MVPEVSIERDIETQKKFVQYNPDTIHIVGYKTIQHAENMSLSDVLNNAVLDAVINSKGRKGVVTLSHNATIAEALETLANKHLLSAPIVVDPEIEDGGGLDGSAPPTLIGWLDLKDIVAALLNFIDSKNTEHKLPTMMLSLMSDLEKVGGQFVNSRLVSVPCIEVCIIKRTTIGKPCV